MLGGLGPAILGGALTIGADVAGVGFAVLERGSGEPISRLRA